MLRSRFLWKLYASYVALILLLTLVVGVMTSEIIQNNFLDQTSSTLRARTLLLEELSSAPLSAEPSTDFQERVRSLGARIGTRLTVIRADGSVIADSDEQPERMDDHIDRPEIVRSKTEEFGPATRFSDTVNTQMMYVAKALRVGDELLGYVRASVSLASLDERLAELRSLITVVALISAGVALILGFFIARSLAGPLAGMASVADALARGEYDRRLPAVGEDEVARLARTLNHMADRLSDRMETVTTDRNKLRAILSAMGEGVIAIDENEIVLHLNAAAATMLDVRQADAIDRSVREIERVREISEALRETLRSSTGSRRKHRLTGPDGDRIIDLRCAPIRDSESVLVGAVAVLDDRTHLARLETIRTDFVANVSHELKTPITAIRGLIETLVDDPEMDPDTRQQFCQRILDQSLRLSTLVSDLLALALLEQEERGFEFQPLDVRDLVETVSRQLLPTASDRGVHLEVDLPESSVVVEGDEEGLRQAITNLVDNALKYTPAGGHVWLRLSEDSARCVIEVEDTGIGIAPRDRERIFERFFRVDKARSRELGSTGLGLSIVKHVTSKHDGRVSVESAPERGSTFRLTLPLAGQGSVG